MSDSKSLSVVTSAARLRHKLIETYRSYHTVVTTPPKVWHTDPDCPGGQQIPVENLRGGRGEKRRRCVLRVNQDETRATIKVRLGATGA